MELGQLSIVLSGVMQILPLLLRQRPGTAYRGTQPEVSAAQPLARRNQATGPYNNLPLHHSPIEDGATHPDQGRSFNPATVQRNVMANGDPLADLQGVAGGACMLAGMGHMKHGAILDIAVSANLNTMDVATYHHIGPDTGAGPDLHLADNNGAGIDPGIVSNTRRFAAKATDIVNGYYPSAA